MKKLCKERKNLYEREETEIRKVVGTIRNVLVAVANFAGVIYNKSVPTENQQAIQGQDI